MKIIVCVRWRLGKKVLQTINEFHDIVSVITDNEEIVEYCIANSLKYIRLENNNDWENAFYEEHDLIVSCMFNKIISENHLSKAKFGGINIHQSILPSYRGKSPVLMALKDRADTIGFTIHYMTSAVDAGNILVQNFWYLDYEQTMEELMNQYITLVPSALIISLGLVASKLNGLEQDGFQVTYCESIDFEFDWNLRLNQITKLMER
ncbi:hypothetical protein LSPCS325_23090 [Lysinibacillus sp. CTST325]